MEVGVPLTGHLEVWSSQRKVPPESRDQLCPDRLMRSRDTVLHMRNGCGECEVLMGAVSLCGRR